MYRVKRLPEFDAWMGGLRDGLVVMLGGGDKSSQERVIELAKKLATTLDFEA